MSVEAFQGTRLKKARIYNGLTVAELSNKISCSRQTISMYESGLNHPKDMETVNRIASVLGFPTNFFLEEDIPVATGSTYFRAQLTTSKKYRDEQIQKMNLIAAIYSFLQEYIKFPQYLAVDYSELSPEEAAAKLRNQWNLGNEPIKNLVYETEQHGILVTTFPTRTDKIDAFSAMVNIDGNAVYLIAYSSNKTSAARIHFDVAHELGHICLHEWSEDIEALDRDEFKEREDEANRFASAFLLPEQTFRRDVEGHATELPYYTQLKAKWKVSIQAMIRRSYSLGIISMDDYQRMIRILQKRGQRKSEPLDDRLQTASPSMLRAAVNMLLEENVFTPDEFMEELANSMNLSLRPKMVEELLDLPEGTLSRPKVIQFPTLQLKTD
jgi:Zn-dependent peptidase ImmA (M78 family)/DNA-binding XRE family transcriptional regulator